MPEIKELVENIINESIAVLKGQKRLFNSEDDFKMALAWEMNKALEKDGAKEDRVFLEYPAVIKKRDVHIDIVVRIKGNHIPIELKYRTSKITFESEYFGEAISLKGQSPSMTRYFLLRDVWRIEQLLSSGTKFKSCGYVLIIANQDTLWSKPRAGWDSGTRDREFRIHEGCEPIKGERAWYSKGEKGISLAPDRPHPHAWHNLDFEGTYPIKWSEYCTIGEDAKKKNGLFRLLMFEVNKESFSKS